MVEWDGAGRRVRRVSPELQETARELRRQMTPAEAKLWELLRDRRLAGLKFRRQHGVGTSVLDFYCRAAKLVVEVDGGIHDEEEQAAHDLRRTEHLAAFGYRVLRVRNEEVLHHLDAVLERIRRAATEEQAIHQAQ